jgi:rubrerythrin
MIQANELVDFICPSCGYITKGIRGEKKHCPKCQPDFMGWVLDKLPEADGWRG